MEDVKIISGNTEEELWHEVEADLSEEVYNYDVLIRQGGKEVGIDLDIDLGGGFESGWEITRLRAPVALTGDFRFAMHDKHFIDSIGKFFGMQDTEIGFAALDEHLIIKTNDANKVRRIFSKADVRDVFESLDSFDCGIHTHHIHTDDKRPFLELNINQGINDPGQLRKIYHAFYNLLTAIEA
jgi:hypothetical protein